MNSLSKSEKQYWLDDPRNVKTIVYTLYAVCALLFAFDMICGEPLLFSAPAQMSKDLDRAILPETLEQAFEDHGHSLADGTVVSVENKNRDWLITDQANRDTYIINLAGDHLDIYRMDTHFAFENWFGFFGWYGFIACVGLVLVAKEMRRFLMRKEDYYEP